MLPYTYPKVVHQIDRRPAQREVVISMGFGSLFHVTSNRMFCFELVDALDMNTMWMYFRGQPIPITYHDVGLVFDLPVSELSCEQEDAKKVSSTIAERLKTYNRKLTAGPQTQTPYTEQPIKQKKKSTKANA